jgi:hypothetical protein
MADYCWCVCYYCYDREESYFNIESGYYGNQAKEQAIKKAIDINIELIKELCDEDASSCEGFIILNNSNISNEEKLKNISIMEIIDIIMKHFMMSVKWSY